MGYLGRKSRLWNGVSLCGLVLLAGCTNLREPFSPIAPIVTPVTPSNPVSKLNFAYVENVYSDSISMYRVSGDGHWTPLSPATVPVGTQPESLVVHPSGRYVYVPNIRDNTISMFAVNTGSGQLTPLTPATVPTGNLPQYIVIDSLGRFAYTANTNDNTLSMFIVDNQTGLLTPTTPAFTPTQVNPGPDSPTNEPTSLAVDPLGRFLYSCNVGSVTSYSIDQSTGVLTPTSPGLVVDVGTAFAANVDPSGQFLYVTDTAYNRLHIFKIDQGSGALVDGSEPLVPSGQNPTAVVMDPTGRFLYMVNRQDGTISQFTRNRTDGSLTPLAPANVSSPGSPWQMLIDPSGQLAYVSQEGTDAVTIFAIGSDGRLSPYSSAPTASVPGGMGIAQVK